ncbi:CLUMA_CG020290, isoform A [Clunio marinus]|uniref:UDP-N-acetylglucosamine diphosphorylase n=1 Tax=Clunio marinus TaxID=568069 RepID=A0A1J1J4J2_9DIPT|nr:CLUMA_CG020290, isoform A [Clunio marinus]
MTNFESLKETLSRYGQEHLLRFWEELSDIERKQLISDIQELNLEEVQSFFMRATASIDESSAKLDDRLKPVPETTFMSISRTNKDQLKIYEDEGLKQISNNHVGVLLMAGGQGTRLGFAHPKGMYDISLPSHKSLFCVQAERIRKLQELAKARTGQEGRITWYIMTSEHTMQPTMNYFKDHDFFGLFEDDIVMFEQGSLPCFDFDGKILLDEKHRISKAPDGNGGLYRALRDTGILDDMNRRGVLSLHAHSVDNILIKIADPIFIGYCVKQSADCAAKVVEKSHPNEAVGVVCMVDGKYQVVEYSEITQSTAEMRNSDGRLTFNAGNICNHYFSAEFLNKIGSTYEKDLKLHVAKKKIPFVDNSGKRIQPDKPNGIKIEKFVFDVFEFAENFVTVEVARDEEFSALKNADSAGKDCATTARNDIYRLHKKYIENAGGFVNGVEVEISPMVSYAGEGLESIVKGQTLKAPIHLTAPHESMIKNGHL